MYLRIVEYWDTQKVLDSVLKTFENGRSFYLGMPIAQNKQGYWVLNGHIECKDEAELLNALNRLKTDLQRVALVSLNLWRSEGEAEYQVGEYTLSTHKWSFSNTIYSVRLGEQEWLFNQSANEAWLWKHIELVRELFTN
jgi:hypothetical protein